MAAPVRRRWTGLPQRAVAPQRRPARRLEQTEQLALMKWARHVELGGETLFDHLIHVPNGGARSKVEGAIFKAMGVKAGVPDILLPLKTSLYGAGWWELKVGNNKPDERQLELHARLRAGGHYVQTYWHWSEAAADILRYLQAGPFQVVVRARM